MHQIGSCVLIPAVSGFARQRTVQVCILKHRAAVHVESISERGESGPFPTRILVSRLSIPVQWIQQTGFHSAFSVGGTFFLRPLIGPFQTHPAFATTLRGVAITWSVTGKFLGVCRWWWFLGGPSPKVPKGSVHVFLYRSEDQKKNQLTTKKRPPPCRRAVRSPDHPLWPRQRHAETAMQCDVRCVVGQIPVRSYGTAIRVPIVPVPDRESV